MNYRLLAVAEQELADAATWYEEQSNGLGRLFLNDFENAIHRICRFPHAWKRVSARHSRCLFRRFPFAVLYTQNENSIW